MRRQPLGLGLLPLERLAAAFVPDFLVRLANGKDAGAVKSRAGTARRTEPSELRSMPGVTGVNQGGFGVVLGRGVLRRHRCRTSSPDIMRRCLNRETGMKLFAVAAAACLLDRLYLAAGGSEFQHLLLQALQAIPCQQIRAAGLQDEVANYQRCIETFISQNRRIPSAHARAAK